MQLKNLATKNVCHLRHVLKSPVDLHVSADSTLQQTII